MNMKWTACVLAAGVSLGAAVFAHGAAENVGELKDLAARITKMPTDPPRLHVTGKITAPTPCYHAVAEHAGDLKDHRRRVAIRRVRVTLRQDPGPGECMAVLHDITFRYMQPELRRQAQKGAGLL